MPIAIDQISVARYCYDDANEMFYSSSVRDSGESRLVIVMAEGVGLSHPETLTRLPRQVRGRRSIVASSEVYACQHQQAAALLALSTSIEKRCYSHGM